MVDFAADSKKLCKLRMEENTNMFRQQEKAHVIGFKSMQLNMMSTIEHMGFEP